MTPLFSSTWGDFIFYDTIHYKSVELLFGDTFIVIEDWSILVMNRHNVSFKNS